MTIFKLDGTCFRFNKYEHVKQNFGLLTEEAQERYEAGYTNYLTKLLIVFKRSHMNICTQCEAHYNTLGNKPGSCHTKGATALHIAMYDFEKDPENVLNCKI
jgi:hypothetical protein